MSAVRYPKTLAELAGDAKPSPSQVLTRAAEIARELRDHEIWADMFAAAAVDASIELSFAPLPDSRGLEYWWVHLPACGRLDACSCTLAAVLTAALEFILENTPPEPIQGSWTAEDGTVYDLAVPYTDRYRKLWRAISIYDGVPYMRSETAGGLLPSVNAMFGPFVPVEVEGEL